MIETPCCNVRNKLRNRRVYKQIGYNKSNNDIYLDNFNIREIYLDGWILFGRLKMCNSFGLVSSDSTDVVEHQIVGQHAG